MKSNLRRIYLTAAVGTMLLAEGQNSITRWSQIPVAFLQQMVIVSIYGYALYRCNPATGKAWMRLLAVAILLMMSWGVIWTQLNP